MYYKHFMTAALAALIFTACNKDETSVPDFNNGETKNVYLRFNTGKTRSIENPEAGKKAELYSAIVYFLDNANEAGRVFDSYVIDGQNGNISIEDLEKGVKFEDVPEAAKVVYVVGNFNSSVNGELASFPTSVGTSFQAIQNVKMEIEQTNIPEIANVSKGTKLLTLLDGKAPVYSVKDAGLGNWNGTGSEQPGSEDFYASVEVSPLSARIEIKELLYTGNLKSFTVEGIYINKFYSQMSVGLTPNTNDLVNYGSVEAKYDRQNQVEFGYTNYTTLYDVVEKAITVVNDETSITLENDQVWAYHIFGNHNPVPQIIIKLTNIIDVNDEEHGTRYLTVKGFKEGGTSLPALERGNVYQVDLLKFDDSHLTLVPSLDAVNVWVSVSVKEWVGVPVTPEL